MVDLYEFQEHKHNTHMVEEPLYSYKLVNSYLELDILVVQGLSKGL